MIDAHLHFWRVGRNDFAWPTPDLAEIHRDFLPEHFAPLADAAGVTGALLVQSQQSDRDTAWLIELARDTPIVRGVVGWADLLAADAPDQIAALAAQPKFRGLRPMLQGLADDYWIAKPRLEPALDAMVAHDLSLDALVLTRHLDALLAVAERRPNLSIVIDHCAKPPIADQAFDDWATKISRLAACPRVTCKISGLLTEAAPGQPDDAILRYVEHVVARFGADRLMWGSDWPVLNLASDYGRWIALARRLCGFREPEALAAFFADTARRVYRLDAPT